MIRAGRILLLECGHSAALDESIKVQCHECDVGTKPGKGDMYQRGYKAGLGSKHQVNVEDMQQIGNAWLETAVERLGHSASCLCQACCIARKLVRLVPINQRSKGWSL